MLIYFDLLGQSARDTLTGLYNRRHLMEDIHRGLALARRHKHSLAIAMIDLDGLKTVNDTHGHAAGDRLLQKFAALLQQETRASDFLCRYGGDEFVVVLPKTGLTGSRAWAKRLLKATNRLRIKVSIGIALYSSTRTKKNTPKSLLQRADQNLYKAKHSGGNTFTIY